MANRITIAGCGAILGGSLACSTTSATIVNASQDAGLSGGQHSNGGSASGGSANGGSTLLSSFTTGGTTFISTGTAGAGVDLLRVDQ